MPTATDNPDLLDEATAWLVRTRDPAFTDWEAFTVWLEASPAHNDAYERALDAHEAAGAVPMRAAPIAMPPPHRVRRRWGLAAGAIAAAVVATIAVPELGARHDRYAIATRAGEQRAVRLADGTRIAMNGATRLTLDRADVRQVRLDAGQATFTVVHDAAHPFEVITGGTTIRDVGTVFDVVRAGGATDVAVAEGVVLYDPDGDAVTLSAGGTLHDPDGGVLQIGTSEPAAIGAWRTGRLIYHAAPLASVATDLSRLIGDPIRVTPAVGVRSFSGTIMVGDGDRAALFARLAKLMDVAVTRDAGGWMLAERSTSTR